MYTAGVDPSEGHTGLVVCLGDELILHTTVAWDQVVRLLDNPSWRPLTVLVEAPPRLRGTWQQTSVVSVIMLELHRLRLDSLWLLNPGIWKPFMKAYWLKHKIPSALEDQHQRDAYSLVVYQQKRGDNKT